MNSQSIDTLNEATRNQLLRRVDWRFLLSNPSPAESVCFAAGSLARAVSAISDRMVAAPQASPERCDLAVALNPDRTTLQRTWSALRPGGECYTEWYVPLAGTAHQIMRRLHNLNFVDVHAYWPWPWPQRTPAFWLPLDAPGLLTYFLQQRAQIGGLKRRLLFKLRARAWHTLNQSGLLWPLCVIARKPGTRDQSLELSRQWADWGLGETPDRLYALLLTGGQRSVNKVVSLIAAAPHAKPRLIIKRPRVPQARAGLQREAAILQQLQQHFSQLQGVPRVVFSQETETVFSLGQTILTGVPLYTRLQPDTFRRLAQQATNWLIEFAAATRAPYHTPLLIETLAAELHDLQQTEVSAGCWRPTPALLASLGKLPVICEQRDFSPWNILIDEDERWNVLDWEAAEIQGLPARDLIYFLTYLSFFVEGVMRSGEYRAAYRRLLDPHTFTGAVFAECQARYAQEVGFEPSMLKALRILTWTHHVRAERARLQARHEVRSNSLFVSLWEEELREQQRED